MARVIPPCGPDREAGYLAGIALSPNGLCARATFAARLAWAAGASSMLRLGAPLAVHPSGGRAMRFLAIRVAKVGAVHLVAPDEPLECLAQEAGFLGGSGHVALVTR